ncbi:MAG: CBU_0592 family membrane protein [Mycobacteriales bacterium]
MEQAIQIAGALLILAAFVSAQARRLDTSATTYLLLNVLGSGALAYDAAHGRQWGFLLLEGVWALVSLWGLIAKARGRAPSPAH